MTQSTIARPVWHPFTQMKNAQPALKVMKGEGSLLELEDGRKIIDCISSWWVNVHGHCHPRIAKAIYEQSLKLEHVIFAGFTHEPAEILAQKLLSKLPGQFSKVFFSDNGSTAVEVALKQAYQYWHNIGESHRKSFLCFDGGYHGDTLGAMSVSGRSAFNVVFNDLLFKVACAPFPTLIEDSKSLLERENFSLDFVGRELAKTPRSYAAVIIEPLVQGAGGMRMCRPEFLQRLEQVVHQHNCLLIYDEVMTGFGRTGEWFSCIKSKTAPDIICLAKGLSGGFLPLAATACTEQVFEAFYSDDMHKTLFHGHSYTANPLGCAAAIASIDLLDENEDLFKGMEARYRFFNKLVENHPRVREFRLCGTIAAMDIEAPGKAGYLNNIGPKMSAYFLEEGILMRPLGNTLYMLPPYCITDDQLEKVFSAIPKVLDRL